MAIARVTGIQYVVTFVGLLVLATVSLLLSFAHLSSGVSVTLSLVLAGGKTLLVMWFFMHLLEQPLSARMVIVVSVLLVVLLVVLTAMDVSTRKTFPARPSPTESSPYDM